MSTKDRGLLIVAVSGMRAWAAGLSGTFRSVITISLHDGLPIDAIDL